MKSIAKRETTTVRGGRRINRGPVKSRQEVTVQIVEDMIESRVADATDHLNESVGVLVAKVLFHQEQIRCAAHGLSLFRAEIDDRSQSPRELLDSLAGLLEAIFDDMIPVHSPEEYATLTQEDIQNHLSQHCGNYHEGADLPDWLAGAEDELVVRVPTRAEAEASRAQQVIDRVNLSRRRRGVPEVHDDPDDILSAVSDEVQDDFVARRRRRR